jgi:hypothetical protein
MGSPHPDLTTIPLDDVEPSHVVLATRAGDRSRLVAAFGKSAHDCLTAPSPPPLRAQQLTPVSSGGNGPG